MGGVGAEFALWNNWSLNTEFLQHAIPETGGELLLQSHLIGWNYLRFQRLRPGSAEFGLNYRWDNPRVAPTPHRCRPQAPLHPCGPARFNGGYVGGNIGGISYTALRQDRDTYISDTGDYFPTKSGFTGGVQAGWDWQSCNKLFGIVADWNWADVDARAAQSPNLRRRYRSAPTKGSMDWFSTIRGRAGLAVDDTLIYVTGGLAAARINSHLRQSWFRHRVNEQFNFSDTRWGLAAGVGAEFALWSGWSVNTDLLYMQFKKEIDTFRSPAPGPHCELRERTTRRGSAASA